MQGVKALPRIVTAILSLAAPVLAVGEPQPLKCVRVFDAMYYTGKPELAEQGVERVRLFASLNWWPDRRHADTLPPRTAVTRWTQTLPEREQMFVIDLEHWPVRGSADVAESVRKKIVLADWIKAEGYSGPVGYYGLLPIRDYWRAIRPPNSAQYRQWQADNDAWKSLVEHVDVVFPSLYTFYPDPNGWDVYAVANIAEARRLSAGKHVYPFLWPQYHNSNRTLGYRYLPADVWKRELETVARHADGIVLWGGSDEQGRRTGRWNPRAEWWLATLDFLAENRERCRR